MKQNSIQKIIAASMVNFMAAGAIVATGSGLDLWKEYLHLSDVDLSWVNALSANCIGAAVGALFGGFLADKYGRQTVFSWNMLLYMLGIALMGTATSFGQYLSGDIICGIAVGAAVPATWTWIAEASKPHHRARNIAISQIGWVLGPAFVLLFSAILAPGSMNFWIVKEFAAMWNVPENIAPQINVFSSRIIFLCLYIVAFIEWVRFRQLEESQMWLEEEKKNPSDKSLKTLFSNLSILFSNKTNLSYLVFLSGLYLLWNLAASVMGFFQSTVLSTTGSLPPTWAQGIPTAQWFVSAIAILFIINKVDTHSQRKFLIFGLICAVVSFLDMMIFGLDSLANIIIFAILWAIQSGISVQLFYSLWITESFPTKYRAAALGVSFCAVRALSTIGGSIFGHVYGTGGENDMICYSLLAATLIVCLFVGWKGTHDNKGKTLEEISQDRA